MVEQHTPEQGDILQIEDFNHPVVVLSKTIYNKSGLIIACPLTKSRTQTPFCFEINIGIYTDSNTDSFMGSFMDSFTDSSTDSFTDSFTDSNTNCKGYWADVDNLRRIDIGARFYRTLGNVGYANLLQLLDPVNSLFDIYEYF